MNPVPDRLLRLVLIACAGLPALGHAQGSSADTFRPFDRRERSPWTVSAGARFSTDGANVSFGGLGAVPARAAAPDLSEGAVDRTYDNGRVLVDTPRGDETLADGTVFSVPGERYQGRRVDAAGNESFEGDFLAYTPGLTREWGYNSESQIASDGRLHMNLYHTEGREGTAAATGDASAGVELSVARRLRRFGGGRGEIGLSATFGFSEIRAGTSESVQADLVRLTDIYRLHGPAPSAPYNGPTAEDILDEEGNVVLAGGRETTVPLDQVPVEREIFTIADGATVIGNWKISGAYYVVRVGPIVRWFITERLAVSLDLGLLGAFVGTDFQTTESFQTPEISAPLTTTEEKDETAFLGGFYGGGSIEYWMTNRTNAHAGAAYESLGNYQQSVNGRTAEIDIGSTVTVRFGLTTRF